MSKDFIRDGLLHCGVCGRPKEYKYDVFGSISTVPVKCDCEFAEIEKQQTQWKQSQRMIRIERLAAEGVRDKQRRECRFENAEMTESLIKCQKYAMNWDEMRANNAGLLMWGPCGNGKSFAAACIANYLIEREIPTLMTSLPMILSESNNNIMDIVTQMREYELAILDDLGAERQSQYALEKTFFVIDERYKSGKPLIVTTNQKLSDMEAMRTSGSADYKRIYDRIFEMCIPMMFDGPSRRDAFQEAKVDALQRIFA